MKPTTKNAQNKKGNWNKNTDINAKNICTTKKVIKTQQVKKK